MGRMKDFLICSGCGESMVDLYYDNDDYDEDWKLRIEGGRIAYTCPLCGTINEIEPLEEG